MHGLRHEVAVTGNEATKVLELMEHLDFGDFYVIDDTVILDLISAYVLEKIL